MSKKKILKYFIISLLIISIDQATKIYTHFNIEIGSIGEIIIIKNLFKIYHIKNPGIAFGIKINHKYSNFFILLIKIIVTIIMHHLQLTLLVSPHLYLFCRVVTVCLI